MKIIPELKRLHSPDVPNLETYCPENRENFGILVQAMFGPFGIDGEESFDFLVCTPEWLAQRLSANVIYSGRHHLICARYDYFRLTEYVKNYAEKIAGENWKEVASKLARLGKWEFEDYV